jgi:hypothetical protein
MRFGIFVLLFSLMLGAVALLDSCKNDTVTSSYEPVTTLKVIAQNLSTNTVDTFQYENFHEHQTGSYPPGYVDTIRLAAKTSYSIQVILINDLTHDVMTDTIIARADSHLMIYNVDPVGMIAVKIQDKDSKGLPLGLMSNWSTADSTNGWLRMILRHQQGNKNGTETPGSNDFEADFPVTVR